MEVIMQLHLILPLFFSILLISGFLMPQKTIKKPLICTNLSNLAHDYSQEAERVMAAIRTEFGISLPVWNKYMDECRDLIARNPLKGKRPAKIRSKILINRLLEEHGIDKKKISIEKLGGKNQAEALQDINGKRIIQRLRINFDWLNTRPICEQEAILRHEIQHLLNYDSIEEVYIKWILTDSGYTQQDWGKSPSMTDYYHLRELRADAFACAENKTVAQSLHDYFCDTVCLNEAEQEWYSHPRDTVRAHQLASLHNLDSQYRVLA